MKGEHTQSENEIKYSRSRVKANVSFCCELQDKIFFFFEVF